MFRLAVVVAFLSPAMSNAQSPPLAGRPTNYSQLIGRFKIAASIEPERVLVEDPLTLRVVIAGKPAAGDPPMRANLKVLPEDLDDSFFIEPQPQDDSARPETETWEFVWKLRPRSTEVREVPSLALAFFSPQVGRYQTVRSEPLPLVVKSRPTVVVDERRETPASFLELAEWPAGYSFARQQIYGCFESSSSMFPHVVSWTIVACGLGVMSWFAGALCARGTTKGGSASQAQRVADAIADLRTPNAHPADVLTRYLQDRFALTAIQPSLAEVERVLKRHGIAIEVRRRWTAWYRASDAAQFAPKAHGLTATLRNEAVALLLATEGTR